MEQEIREPGGAYGLVGWMLESREEQAKHEGSEEPTRWKPSDEVGVCAVPDVTWSATILKARPFNYYHM